MTCFPMRVVRLALWLGLFSQLGCSASAQAEAEGPSYPLLANLWYAPEIRSEKHIDYLGRYDWLFVDINNAYDYASALQQLRARNPELVLLAYVNPLEIWKEGTRPYDLPFQRRILQRIDEAMFLHTVSGRRFHQPAWDRMVVMNTMVQYPAGMAHWLDVFHELLLDEKILAQFDGFFLDNINPTAFYTHTSPDSFDLDADGAFDTREQLDDWHRRETETFLMLLRREIPLRPLVGNGGHLVYHELLNGTVFEGFPVPWLVPESEATPYNNWRQNMAHAMDGATQFHSPMRTVFNGNGEADDFQKMRFTLTSALIAGVACSFDQGDVSHTQLYWFDEYAVDPTTGVPDPAQDVTHRGYLGAPKGDYEVRDFAFFREFENGLAVCNPWDVPIDVKLPDAFQTIHGRQDPLANPGGETRGFRLEARDGRVLLHRKE